MKNHGSKLEAKSCVHFGSEGGPWQLWMWLINGSIEVSRKSIETLETL